MRRFLLLAGAVVLTLGLAAQPAAATGQSQLRLPFLVAAYEDFDASLCPRGVDPNQVDSCGRAIGTGIGLASFATVIDAFGPPTGPPGCFTDVHTSTYYPIGTRSRLVLVMTGVFCLAGPPTSAPPFTFTGTYSVVDGTGIYTGAQGSGTNQSQRANDGGVITTKLRGSLILN